jgi:hypothetical protein
LVALLSVFVLSSGLCGERSREIYSARCHGTLASRPGGPAERTLETYNKFMAGEGNRLRGKTVETADAADVALAKKLLTLLFTRAAEGGADPHAVVAFLTDYGLDKGAVSRSYRILATEKGYRNWRIDPTVNQMMGLARDALVREAIVGAVRDNPDGLGKKADGPGRKYKGRWKVARSDTGSVGSGVKADHDQTFYVFKEVDGEWIRAPELDVDFLDALRKSWTDRNGGLTTDMLKVNSFEGRYRLPDPRSYSDVASYRRAYLGALAGLRTADGAHATFGGIVQSVDVRRKEALRALRNPDNPDAWRNRRVWQEFGVDPDAPEGRQRGELPVRDYSLATRTLLVGPSPLLPDVAFGSAAAEYLSLVRSYAGDSFNAKYHLNVIDHALAARMRQDVRSPRPGTISSVDMPDAGRGGLYRDMVFTLFGGKAPDADSAKRMGDHVLALEISADLRRLHQGKPVKALQGRGKKPHGKARDLALFEPLLRRLYGEKYQPGEGKLAQWRTSRQLAAAKKYHRKLATELAFEAVLKTAPDAFRLLVDPGALERCRPLLGGGGADWATTKTTYQEGVKLGLLSTLYDIGSGRRTELVKRLGIEFPDKAPDLGKLAVSSRLFPVETLRANPSAYGRYTSQAISSFAAAAGDHVLFELGFERLGDVELQGEMMRRQRLVWHPAKLVKNMFWDLGTIDAMAKITETYYVTKGDWEQVAAKVREELILALPVVGQGVSIYRGGAKTAALLLLARAYPIVGQVLVVYSVGQSAYVVYHAVVIVPELDSAQAVYNGIAGPDLSAYYAQPGRPTPVWNTTEDDRLLAAARTNLERVLRQRDEARAKLPDPSRVRNYDEYRRRVAALEAFEKEWSPGVALAQAEVARLEGRKRTWEAMVKGGWKGYAPEKDEALKENPRLRRSVLELVDDPRFVFVGTQEMVDRRPVYTSLDGKRRVYDPSWADGALEALAKKVKQSLTIEEAIRARSEEHELELLRDRYKRGQRYWERATSKSPWLLCRFRRDSLFDFCRRTYTDQKAFTKRVDAFLKGNAQLFYDDLVRLGLRKRDPAAHPLGGGLSDREVQAWIKAIALPERTVDRIHEKIAADYARSQALIESYEKVEMQRFEARKAAVAKHTKALRNEAFVAASREKMSKEKLGDTLVALRFSGVRRSRPIVRTRFYRALTETKELRSGPEGKTIPPDGANAVHASGYVYADDTLYLRPYRLETVFLKKEQLGSLGGKVGDRSLLPETLTVIRELAEKHATEIEGGRGMIGVATVLAKGMGDLKGALPSTIEGLPGIMDGKPIKGEVTMGQQAAFIPLEELKIVADPISVVVRDQAGSRIVGGDHEDKLAVTIAGKHPLRKGEEFLSSHQFTKYGETIDIVAEFKMSDGDKVTATKQFSIDDLESWTQPESPDGIEITLPIFLPESFTVKGVVAAEAPRNAQGQPMATPREARVTNELLGISGKADLSRGDAEKGAFQIPVKAVVRAGATVRLIARGVASRSVFQAEAAKPLPEKPGTIDFGTITIRAVKQTVRVPEWDRQNPPSYKTYDAKLGAVGLVGKPKLGKPTAETRLQYKVLSTTPSAGTAVQAGTSVVVVLHDKFAPRVPDVVGLHVSTATKKLSDCGFTKITKVIGGDADSKRKEYTVSHQSVKPGTEHAPDGPIKLTILGRFVATNAVPDLGGMTESEAKAALRTAELRLEIADHRQAPPTPNDAGRVYRQEPRAKSMVGADTAVKAWLYAGREGDQEQGGAFYAVLRMTGYEPKGKLKIPDPEIKIPKGNYKENPKLAVQAIVRASQSGMDQLARAIDDMGEGVFKQTSGGPEDIPFILHVAGRALGTYPRSMFKPGSKFFCPIQIELSGAGEKATYDMGILLTTDRILDSLDEAEGSYAELLKNEFTSKFLFARFQTRDGKASATFTEDKIKTVSYSWSFNHGPLTQGWTKINMKHTRRSYGFNHVYSKVFPAVLQAALMRDWDADERRAE